MEVHLMDIIIFSGQSNMQGESERLSSTEMITGAYEYKYLTDTAVPLRNPVGEDITYEGTCGFPFTHGTVQHTWLETHALGSACFGHTNLVPSFCDTYYKKTNREVLAVHAAKGSSAMDKWMPGKPQYEILIQKSQAAIRYAEEHDSVGRIFFVWLQGESDAIQAKSKEYYKESITVLYDALSDTVGIERFGIIRVGHFCKDNRDLEITGAQDEICREHDGFLMLTTLTEQLETIPDCMHPDIQGHFGAKGLELLGTAAGEALADFVNQTTRDNLYRQHAGYSVW